MPAAIQKLLHHNQTSTTAGERELLVEKVPLFLPSDLSSRERSGSCYKGLGDIELRLRDAQCQSSLDQLRNQLHIKSRLLTYKGINVRHQGPNTRARSLITRNEAKICLHAEKYRAARAAKCRLLDGDNESVEWMPLRQEDVRCMQDAEDLEVQKKKEEERRATGTKEVRGSKEGYRQLSWIWLGTDTNSGQAVREALRVEWTKARARAQRWAEEVRLLREEMRRVLITLDHQAREWDDRVNRRSFTVDIVLHDGLRAYGRRQAELRRGLAQKFAKMWTEENISAKISTGGVSGVEESGEMELNSALEDDMEEDEQAEGDIGDDGLVID